MSLCMCKSVSYLLTEKYRKKKKVKRETVKGNPGPITILRQYSN